LYAFWAGFVAACINNDDDDDDTSKKFLLYTFLFLVREVADVGTKLSAAARPGSIVHSV